MSKEGMDGSYYAEGDEVRKNPNRTSSGITMGFFVCQCNPDVPNAAEHIAEALNEKQKRETK